jgi:hypothetical protein
MFDNVPAAGDEGNAQRRGLGGTGWRGDKVWRDLVKRIRQGGDIPVDPIPTKSEALDLLDEAGATVDRIENAHSPPNPHQYPHINFTTVDGTKGTIQITGL